MTSKCASTLNGFRVHLFDPADFLSLAGRLCTPSSSEAEFRTSVSRSYYASFLAARERLEMLERYVPARSGRDHQGVIDTLASLPGSGPLRDKLDGLRQLRTWADYELGNPVGFKEATRAKLIAQVLLQGIPRIT